MSTEIRHLRWMLVDSLSNAIHLAARCQQATEGTEATLLFEAAMKAIFDLRDGHPAMKALASAAAKEVMG
jgi:hypothetical protein